MTYTRAKAADGANTGAVGVAQHLNGVTQYLRHNNVPKTLLKTLVLQAVSAPSPPRELRSPALSP